MQTIAMCIFVFNITDNLLINLHHVVFLDKVNSKSFWEFAQIHVSVFLYQTAEVSDNLRRYHDLPDTTSNFLNVWHGLACWTFRCHGLITWLQVLNHDLLFSVPCCFLLDRLIKEATCNVMVDHLQSRVTPWRQYASHVKVHGTLLKMDVFLCILSTTKTKLFLSYLISCRNADWDSVAAISWCGTRETLLVNHLL